MDEIYNILSSL